VSDVVLTRILYSLCICCTADT